MSRSPSGPVDPARPGDHAAYVDAFAELNRLIRRGRPFSGHEPNCAFLNTGGRRWATASAVTGIDYPDDGRALARVDWDHDGDLDLVLVNRTAPQIRLLRNDLAPHPGVGVRLVDRGMNRDAIGARVTLRPTGPDPRPMVRGLRAGEGYLSQSSRWIHFGLGVDAGIESVEVRWPDGERERFEGVRPGARFVLERGEGVAQEATRVAVPAGLEPAEAPTRATGIRVRTPFRARVPVPELPFEDWDGAPRRLVPASPGPTLVQLWAAWCAPCVREMNVFTSGRDRLRDSGLRVVALSVDGLGDDHDTGPREARAVVESTGFPFDSGMATVETLELLAAFQRAAFGRERPFPVPTSVLLDRDGVAAVLYKGEVDFEGLLADVRSLREAPDGLPEGALAEPGRWIERPPRGLAGAVARALLEDGRSTEAGAYLRTALALGARRPEVAEDPTVVTALGDLGQERLEDGAFEQAASWFAEAVRRRPTDVTARLGLGRALGRLGRHAEAEDHLRAALDTDPGLAAVHHDLAVAIANQGRPAEAIVELDRAVQLDPDRSDAWVLAGNLRVETGDAAGAVDAFRRASDLRPQDADVRVRLASVSLMDGDVAGAERALDEALALDPDHAAGRTTLGMVLEATGRAPEAVPHYRRAAASGSNPLVSIRLARILATDPDPAVRDGQEAELEARRACEATGWQDPEALSALAAALAERGRFEDAAEIAFRALVLARDAGRADAAARYEAERERYRRGEAVRRVER